ncbi:MAG TPA: hypothetical protein VLB27_01550, partial [candidate division Zixibacteria bacterium]|nr:hypothetical protein [candidate division Zixibacteria bacterium]
QKYTAAAKPTESLVTAGLHKGENYDIVYSGGMMAALAFDAAIRNHTNGAASIDDYIREIYTRFPKDKPGAPAIAVDDLIRVATEVGGEEAAQTLNSIIHTSGKFSLDDTFDILGLTVDETGAVALRDGPTERQSALWSAIVQR